MAMLWAGIFHCSMEYCNLKNTPGSNVTLQELGFQMDMGVYLHIRQTWLAFSESLPVASSEIHSQLHIFAIQTRQIQADFQAQVRQNL